MTICEKVYMKSKKHYSVEIEGLRKSRFNEESKKKTKTKVRCRGKKEPVASKNYRRMCMFLTRPKTSQHSQGAILPKSRPLCWQERM